MSQEQRPKCPKCTDSKVVIYEYTKGVPTRFICWSCGTKWRPSIKGVAILWQPPDELQERMVFPFPLQSQEVGG